MFSQTLVNKCLDLAALFTIANNLKNPKCPSTHEWTNKMCYGHTVDYYAAVKKGMTFWCTWQCGWVLITCSVKEAGHRRAHIVCLNFYKMPKQNSDWLQPGMVEELDFKWTGAIFLKWRKSFVFWLW